MTSGQEDLHIHSNYSDGAACIEEIVHRAAVLKLKTISIVDHFWPSTGSQKGGVNIIEQRRHEIETCREDYPDLNILDSVEVDIQSNGDLAPVAGDLDQFDLVRFIGTLTQRDGHLLLSKHYEERSFKF